ncbi:MAG: hypothetical protein HYV07_01400 [Deltaproteobacteria bacterium]|nr:hypothetical protein [Deltaproteobacteria bacterium]
MDPEIGAAVRKAAKQSQMSVSAWLEEAAAAQLKHELLGQALDEWETEDGPPSPEELAATTKVLGLGSRRRRR